MVELEQVERQVAQLNPSDFEEFKRWFREYEWREWDSKIERDSKSGKLKSLAEKALADHAAGRTSPL